MKEKLYYATNQVHQTFVGMCLQYINVWPPPPPSSPLMGYFTPGLASTLVCPPEPWIRYMLNWPPLMRQAEMSFYLMVFV